MSVCISYLCPYLLLPLPYLAYLLQAIQLLCWIHMCKFACMHFNHTSTSTHPHVPSLQRSWQWLPKDISIFSPVKVPWVGGGGFLRWAQWVVCPGCSWSHAAWTFHVWWKQALPPVLGCLPLEFWAPVNPRQPAWCRLEERLMLPLCIIN